MRDELDMQEDGDLQVGFSSRIQARLRALLEQGELGWDELVRNCSGAYPVDVYKELCWLVDKEEVVQAADSRYKLASNRLESQAEAEVCRIQGSRSPYHSFLPEPHPADFDWRFTQEAIDVLLGQIDLVASPDDRIAVLGAPTLFLALTARGANVKLFDNNAHLIRGLRNAGYANLVQRDLFDRLADEGNYAIVVADPPWYPEHYHAFVRSAVTLLRTGGILLLSVLPELTRPAAKADRAGLTDLMARYGFSQMTKMENTLLYDCPPFEMAALRRQGLNCEPWRSGDLVIYQLQSAEDDAEFLAIPTSDRTSWRTFALNQLVVKVRCRHAKDGGEFDFCPVSKDGMAALGTVSRRDPLRESIDLWTSRNSAFRVSRFDVLLNLLQFMESGTSDPLTAVQQAYRLTETERYKMSQLISLLMAESLS